jgi:catalase
MTLTPEHALDVINKRFGRHAGYRALHAKGILFKGTFTPTPEAAALTRAAHMQGEPVPATFRFSNGAGNPNHPDYAPDPRGFAIKMYLPDGSRTDLVSVSNELLPTKTPDGFIALLDAQNSPWKMPLFFARYPGALAALPKTLPTLRPPTSYATITYFTIHAYKWIDANGGERFVRYTLKPEHEEPRLGPREARKRGREYLQDEIRERVQRGPVRFTLEVQIAEPGDVTDDPTRSWPNTRRRVEVGAFEVTALETEREKGDDILVFDPTRVIDGIELSEDPVLNFRPKAYSESVARRTAKS